MWVAMPSPTPQKYNGWGRTVDGRPPIRPYPANAGREEERTEAASWNVSSRVSFDIFVEPERVLDYRYHARPECRPRPTADDGFVQLAIKSESLAERRTDKIGKHLSRRAGNVAGDVDTELEHF
jgi:hypothetical protein